MTWEQRVMEGDPKFDASQQHPQCSLSSLRRADRAQGHLRRSPGGDRRGLGGGARRRPASRPRSQDRSGGAAVALAHLTRAGQAFDLRFDQGRPQRGQRHREYGKAAAERRSPLQEALKRGTPRQPVWRKGRNRTLHAVLRRVFFSLGISHVRSVANRYPYSRARLQIMEGGR